MISRVWIGFLWLVLVTTELNGRNFGFIHANTQNIGDDVQTLAALQFLPEDSIPVERELVGKFTHPSQVDVLMNGWFMHPRQGKYHWPPSASINPFFISIHLTAGLIPVVLSPDNVKYLRNHSPIGARDYFTLNQLSTSGIPAYFSGCLTLTLENDASEREDVIYAVDLDRECVEFLRSITATPVVELTHESHTFYSMTLEERLDVARALLEKYKRAKYVVTTRLHVALPCLAFKTPLLFVNTQGDQSRFDGLIQLMRHVSKYEFLDGADGFNFDNPTPNSDDYLPIRDHLITLVKSWCSLD